MTWQTPDQRWTGTAQFKDATDISRYLVHMTRTEDDLISILREGVIEARSPFGLIPARAPAIERLHHAVCLTEMPIRELGRMYPRGRRWGLVFDKERLREKNNATPVWYVNDPSPQLDLLWDAAHGAAAEPSDPIWNITPYVQSVRSFSTGRPNDWRWEREWRIVGDISFEMSDVAMVVTDNAGRPDFVENISVGVPWRGSDGDTQWVDGPTAGWDASAQGMLRRFESTFLTASEAGAVWDRETSSWYSFVPILDTAEAMDEVFGRMNPDLYAALREAISRFGDEWCRIYDWRNAGD